ncbi:MAG: UDP-N-acetylglucosamine 2-epimerase (non-hydrolyzing) [Ignavibacteriae bacterium]|nr:UDP-N-acetylglucosamine 2-epimerase (non-hydrolyzing) [Ignavibacteriota bacterium]
MIKKLKILNVVGARPNFMKVAPLMREYAKHADRIEATLLHTGQHYDDAMSTIFFTQLEMPAPHVNLGVGSGSHAEQTAKIMIGFEEVLLREKPDVIVVVGDVNSTMACTLVASKLLIPIAHVEAGLRSFDRTMPEEINRLVTDALADILLTTSPDADENLKREGVASEKIHFVGNTMIDTLLALRPQFNVAGMRSRFGLNTRPFAFVTLHRPSNVDVKEVFEGICHAFAEIQKLITLVWPLHPRTRNMLRTHGLDSLIDSLPNLKMSEPLSYLDSTSLMSGSTLVLTDSGGVQEETTVLGIPCLTLRENTERPITVEEGTNELIGNDPGIIISKTRNILDGNSKKGRLPKYWDGKAAQRIVNVLTSTLERPQ